MTMFEVGKLTDESMDNFLLELDKVYSSISSHDFNVILVT